MIFIVCLTFSYFEFDPKIVIIKKEIWKGCDSYSEISLRWTGVPWTTNITYLPCIIPLDSLYLWKVMYRSNRSFNIPPPPGAHPGHLTSLLSRGGGNLIIRVFQGWGIWTVVSIHVKSLGALHVTSYHGRDAVCDKRRLQTYRLAGKWGKDFCEML